MIETTIALYGAQAMNYLLPMVTIPYLARVLGPQAWGQVMFVMAIASFVQLFVNYSFDLSATRDVARNKEDYATLARTVAGVLGARILLALGAILTVAIAQLILPTLAELGWLLWLGMIWFIAMGFHPIWFYLGVERVRLAMTIDVGTRVLAVSLVFLLVNSPSDAWLVFALQGGAMVLTSMITTAMIYWTVPFRRPDLCEARRSLREGAGLFFFRASTSLYGMSNTMILGFTAPAASVAFYSPAERIQRLMQSALLPVITALFPRASVLATDDPAKAARLARVSTFGLVVIASFGAAIVFFLAPSIIGILLGPGYDQVVPVLQILLLVVVINSANIPISHHWLIPNGHERLLTTVTASAGIVHIPMAILLATQYSHIGVAWALVITQGIILTLLITIPAFKEIGPFRGRIPNNPTGVSAPKIGES